MDNVMQILLIVLLALVAVLYTILRTVMEKLSVAKMKNTEYEYAIKELKKLNLALRDEMKLNAKMERETNEKIDSLHTGDSVANAINGLSKHSGSNG